MTLVTKDLLWFEMFPLLRIVLWGRAGSKKKWAKRVSVRMQCSAPFHPEMFISLIPTEGKCTPLELMVGWANFSRLCTHNTCTHNKHTLAQRSESTECLKGERKDDESEWRKKKDKKSTTAMVSMRGKWDMKRDVFLTYLSDNREADGPI